MKRFCLLLFVLLGAWNTLQAQGKLPRLFLDVPAIYLTSPDVTNIDERAGAGLHIAMNVATHWGVVRAGGGSDFLFSLKDLDSATDAETFFISPYGLLEAGAGLYRSNGNKCARTNQNAFTAMAKGGLRYYFNEDALTAPEGETPEQLDFALGAEFGYFFISDVFRNWEVFLDGHYFTNSEAIQVRFGTKFFLNLRSNR